MGGFNSALPTFRICSADHQNSYESYQSSINHSVVPPLRCGNGGVEPLVHLKSDLLFGRAGLAGLQGKCKEAGLLGMRA